MTLFRLDHILDSLILDNSRLEGTFAVQDLAWLEKSHSDPRSFFASFLADYYRSRGGSAKSGAFDHYDFYYDIFENQGRNDQAAYIYFDVNLRRHVISFRRLKALVDRKAEDWISRGVAPGSVVCLVLPMGLDFVLGVLAALKLGAVVSFLSPSRPYLLKRQLAILAPDFISTATAFADLLPRDRILEQMPVVRPSTETEIRSQVYQAGSPAARLFDYSLETLMEPVDISCDDLFLNGLRDGLIALNLGPGDIVAAPGFPFAGTQPFLLLASLLTGAAYLNVSPKQFRKNPNIFQVTPPTVVGITDAFRDLLLERPGDLFRACKFWFRPWTAVPDTGKWQLFISRMALTERFTGVLLWHTQAGGLLAFSRRRKGLAMDTVMPSAGMTWQLLPPVDQGMLPSDRFGLLSFPAADGTERATPFLFVRSGGEWLSPASILPMRQGRCYPIELVENFIREKKISRHFFCIVKIQRPGANQVVHELLIFTGSRTGIDQAVSARKIQQRITAELGPEYMPDRVVFLPVLPRLAADGTMDADWCRKEYAANRLTRKAGNKLFAGLSLLKELILIQYRSKPV